MEIGPFQVAGNIPTQNRLWNYLRNGKVHPSIILSGPEMGSKLQIAKNIAKYLLNPELPPEKIWSEKNNTSRRIERNLHPDVIVYDEPEENIIKVETVRDIIHQMEVSPLEAEAKVCIINECHRMPPGSANALLKTLEEPLPNRYFWLLTTQEGSLLPTIRSRSLFYYFKPEGDGISEENTLAFSQIVAEYQGSLDPGTLKALNGDKIKCLEFVQYLQTEIRGKAVASEGSWDLINAFEAAHTLESRLRTNANYGLMVENYMERFGTML